MNSDPFSYQALVHQEACASHRKTKTVRISNIMNWESTRCLHSATNLPTRKQTDLPPKHGRQVSMPGPSHTMSLPYHAPLISGPSHTMPQCSLSHAALHPPLLLPYLSYTQPLSYPARTTHGPSHILLALHPPIVIP
jgi:hypothetical protein